MKNKRKKNKKRKLKKRKKSKLSKVKKSQYKAIDLQKIFTFKFETLGKALKNFKKKQEREFLKREKSKSKQ